MEFLNWINDIISSLLSFIPRPIIVRATHGGVKWPWGKTAKEMCPGFHWYWPFSTEFEVIPIARQTLNLKTQALMMDTTNLISTRKKPSTSVSI